MLEAPGPPFIQMMFGVTLEIRICVRPQIRHFHSCPFPILTNPALPLSIQSAALGNKSTRTGRCKRSCRRNQQNMSFSSGSLLLQVKCIEVGILELCVVVPATQIL